MGREYGEGANLIAVFGKIIPGCPRLSSLEGRSKRNVLGEISILPSSSASNS